MTRLSICIPTYNFAEFIGETLQSVLRQSADDVEVVVLDSGSTDATPEIVRSFQQEFPALRYYRREKKGGIDRDLAETVSLARGEYCWLMSSDDTLIPGSIARVLDEIGRGHDIYLCNRVECDRDLVPVRERPWFPRRVGNSEFDLSVRSDLLVYLDAAQSIGALFSYISSIVVRRSRWEQVGYAEALGGTNYAHVFRLFSIARAGGRLKYLSTPLVLCRGDNDSFGDKGQLNRFLIDLDGYQLLASRLFPGDEAAEHAFKAVMRREHAWFMLASLRSRVANARDWNNFEERLSSYGYSRAQLRVIRMLGASGPLLSVAQHLRRTLAGAKRWVRWVLAKPRRDSVGAPRR